MKEAGKSLKIFERIIFIVETYAIVIALILMMTIFGMLNPKIFLSWANISTVMGSQAVLVVLTLALIFPLTTEAFDLSAASVLSLASMMIAVINVEMSVPIGWAILAAILTGVLVGMINSFFIVKIGIHSLIVTLGTGTFLNGIVQLISNSQTISGISDSLVNYVIIYRFIGIPLVFYYALVICVLVWYIFQYTSLGTQLLFVGRGPDVSRLTGIRVTYVRCGALITSSFISSIAGVFYAGTSGAADPTSGSSFLLPAFAAAFFGSTSINPGRFNAWGAFIAVYFLAFGISALTIQGIQTYVQNLFYGGALILAVTLSTLVQRHRLSD